MEVRTGDKHATAMEVRGQDVRQIYSRNYCFHGNHGEIASARAAKQVRDGGGGGFIAMF